MTAAEDRREELEALLWRLVAPGFQDRREGADAVNLVLEHADAYAKATRPRAPKKPSGPPKPPAVHYPLPDSDRTACHPYDRFSASRWKTATDPKTVTCEHCKKTPVWQEAAKAGGDP